MSGFVVGYGGPSRPDIEMMFVKIAHRGPYLSKIMQHKNAIGAQNYLKSDVGGTAQEQQIPVTSFQYPERHIYYDGQIGNLPELSQQVGEPRGPFWEERVMLALYQQHGSEMFRFLTDAIFAFIILDGDRLVAARDVLGIKTLFYGWEEDTLYLASELKSLVTVTENVVEFPAGHWMDKQGNATRKDFRSTKNFGMFQKPRLSNAVSHRVFLMAVGRTPGVLPDNRGVSETCQNFYPRALVVFQVIFDRFVPQISLSASVWTGISVIHENPSFTYTKIHLPPCQILQLPDNKRVTDKISFFK